MSRSSRTMAALAACALCGSMAAHAQQTPLALKLDQETPVGSTTAVCTGIGQSKNDPRWSAYPLRIELANDLREHLIGADVTVEDAAGLPVIAVHCPGPWLLLNLSHGSSYKVQVRIAGSDAPPQSKVLKLPATGQMREVFVFPGL